jgi:hypothetical protein
VHARAVVDERGGHRSRRADLALVLDDDEAVAGPRGAGRVAVEGVVVERVVDVVVAFGRRMREDDGPVGDGTHRQVRPRFLRRLDVDAVVPGQLEAEGKGALGRIGAPEAGRRLRHRGVEPGGFGLRRPGGQKGWAEDHANHEEGGRPGASRPGLHSLVGSPISHCKQWSPLWAGLAQNPREAGKSHGSDRGCAATWPGAPAATRCSPSPPPARSSCAGLSRSAGSSGAAARRPRSRSGPAPPPAARRCRCR